MEERVLLCSFTGSAGQKKEVEQLVCTWRKIAKPFGIDIVGDTKQGYEIQGIGREGEPVEEPSLIHEESKEAVKEAGKKRGGRPKKIREGGPLKRLRFDEKVSRALGNVPDKPMLQATNPVQVDRQSVNMPLGNFEDVNQTWQYSQSDFGLNYYNDNIDNDLNWNDCNDDVVETGNEYAQPSGESQDDRWLDSDKAISEESPYSSVWSIGGDYNFGLDMNEDSPFKSDSESDFE